MEADAILRAAAADADVITTAAHDDAARVLADARAIAATESTRMLSEAEQEAAAKVAEITDSIDLTTPEPPAATAGATGASVTEVELAEVAVTRTTVREDVLIEAVPLRWRPEGASPTNGTLDPAAANGTNGGNGNGANGSAAASTPADGTGAAKPAKARRRFLIFGRR